MCKRCNLEDQRYYEKRGKYNRRYRNYDCDTCNNYKCPDCPCMCPSTKYAVVNLCDTFILWEQNRYKCGRRCY